MKLSFKGVEKLGKSLVNTATGSIEKVFQGDFVGSLKSAIPGFESTKTLTGKSDNQTLGVLGSIGGAGYLNSGQGLLASLFAGSSGSNGGLLGTLFGSGDNNFLSSILGSVVKGAVGIGADYFSNQQYYKDQTKLNEQTFGHNRALADEAYQRDVAMWRMQNAYNAPKEQMARLHAAGLNPNLVYGSGNVTGNTAGSPPSYPVVQYPSAKAQKLDLMRSVLGIFDEYQQIKNQALDNQREAYRILLQERSLALAEEREKNRDKQNQRQFEMMMANLGFQRDKEETRVQEHKQDREDKKNAPTTSQKEFNWIADKVGDALQYPIYYGLRYLDWASGNQTKTTGKYSRKK